MKKSEILRRVRNEVFAVTPTHTFTPFVCVSLGNFAWEHHGTSHDVHILTKWIRQLLDGNTTLEGWLVSKHGIRVSDTMEYAIKIQKTRYNWLTWMIKYWEAKGD